MRARRAGLSAVLGGARLRGRRGKGWRLRCWGVGGVGVGGGGGRGVREGWVRAGEGGCAGEGGLGGREGEGGCDALRRGSVRSVAGSAVVVRVLWWRVIGWRTVVGVAPFWGRGALALVLALAVDLDGAFDEAFDFGLGASVLE